MGSSVRKGQDNSGRGLTCVGSHLDDEAMFDFGLIDTPPMEILGKLPNPIRAVTLIRA